MLYVKRDLSMVITADSSKPFYRKFPIYGK